MLATHAILGGLISVALCAALVGLSSRIFALIPRSDLNARQASHLRPTLRLGGVAIICGLWLTMLATGATPTQASILLSAIPLFAVGFLEDFGRHQSPRRRLAAAAFSGLLVVWFSGIQIDRIGVPQLEPFMTYLPVTLGLSIFVTVGLSHAFNLVDGLNGLSGSITLTSIAGLIGVLVFAGSADSSNLLLALAGAVVGFLLFNFPHGRIFLGDAGAYCIGFILAWTAVDLMVQLPQFSPWAAVLIFFWPVADTLFTILRRLSQGRKIYHPDRLHFHQVVLRTLEITWVGRHNRTIANPLATVLMLPLFAVPVGLGVMFWNQNGRAGWSFVAAFACYAVTYRALIKFAKAHRSSRIHRALLAAASEASDLGTATPDMQDRLR
jgi:UDP-N-acetylmuramyl pentapeptide phosphotransferase/UDP-N-acetylglucosamine-1-phosphate transferase